jgi:multiple sugar transport system ATP-binding protein
MFVASFIGSPAMSLIPLTVVTHGTVVALSSPEGWELPLSAANGRKALGAKSNKVVLGARHSTIKLHKQQVPGSVPAKVYTVEPTGDITFVQVFLSGAVVNISLPPSAEVAPDEAVFVEFDQDRLHLFDGETEMALRAAN